MIGLVVRRRDMAAEAVAGFLWGLLAGVLGLLVVSGLLGRVIPLLRIVAPATGAPLPAILALAAGALGAWWRVSFATAGKGAYDS